MLHARPYQETSLLLELFTLEQGRIVAVAKGAKRPKSKSYGLLQPFSPLWLFCVGKHELLTLAEVEAAHAPHHLQGRRLISALYVNELLVRLLNKHDPHAGLFIDYQQTLEKLAMGVCEQTALRIFEKRLLKALGYGLPLMTVDPEPYYLFDPEQGALPVPSQLREVSFRHHAILKGSSLLALEQECFTDPRTLFDAKKILRHALNLRLGSKPLGSRRLLHYNYA